MASRVWPLAQSLGQEEPQDNQADTSMRPKLPPNTEKGGCIREAQRGGSCVEEHRSQGPPGEQKQPLPSDGSWQVRGREATVAGAGKKALAQTDQWERGQVTAVLCLTGVPGHRGSPLGWLPQHLIAWESQGETT